MAAPSACALVVEGYAADGDTIFRAIPCSLLYKRISVIHHHRFAASLSVVRHLVPNVPAISRVQRMSDILVARKSLWVTRKIGRPYPSC